ncbi:hypothetical protein C5167_021192 [Papaver somniferum]|uniref:Uncharacterized protein n=1 Tax=Papaver somniferum TaxID=3469 RepID=A0A4Y7IZ42_PAPSO|nr:hypothetical protein C5167_021192 [Papaver somniferum]
MGASVIDHESIPVLDMQNLLSLQETMESYSSEMKLICMVLFRMMEKAPQVVDIKGIRELFEDGLESMRMNYYPPCPLGLAILLQLSEVDELQIRKEEVSVKPLPDSFIVNVGNVSQTMEFNGPSITGQY